MGHHAPEFLREELQDTCAEVLDSSARISSFGAERHLLEWDSVESTGFIHATRLAAGVSLHVARLRCANPLDWELPYAPSPLEFCLARGPSCTTIADDGQSLHQPGTAAMVSQNRRRGRLRCSWDEGGEGEFVCLSIAPERLQSLFGLRALPDSVQAMTVEEAGRSQLTLQLAPKLSTILDELIDLDPLKSSSPVLLEAKGLEILALMMDELTAPTEKDCRLTRQEVESLHRARQLLLSQMQAPPTLKALARYAGLSETRLKSSYRSLFGRPVFTDLREFRLGEARRLLQRGRMTVSEVAGRVGYDNPSKFAAAFKRAYGQPPSAVA